MRIRKGRDRGRTSLDWLDSRHTFSFGAYHDPAYAGFGVLRVINDDRVAPGAGFGAHPHRDMEIITLVLEGKLEHQDSMGNGSVVRPGDVQRMSAGTGVTHSEFNRSKTEPVHFLQIWILPDGDGYEPAYEQKHFPERERAENLRLIASRQGRDGSVSLNQDADVYVGLLDRDGGRTFEARPDRDVWVQIARGNLRLNGEPLEAGDGAAIREPGHLELADGEGAECVIFDLPRVA